MHTGIVARAALALALTAAATTPRPQSSSDAYATWFNFAPEDVLDGHDGLEPHPLQPFRYGQPLYPTTVDGNGLEMVEAHLSYWEGRYYMYSATWGCGGGILVYARLGDGLYPASPVYPPGDYGADGNCGIKTYSSDDLTNWELRDFYQPSATVANVTKPLVRYSKASQRYVLFMGGPEREGLYFATSTTPSGPWSSPPRFLEGQHLSHDFDVFEAPDGTHYIVTDPFEGMVITPENQVPTWNIWVQQLTPDLAATVNTSSTVALVRSTDQLIRQNLTLEAVGAFSHDGHYYLTFGYTCQNCAGYIYYFHSEHPLGPYQDGGFLSLDGCGGQNKGANVLPTPNGTVVLAGVLGYRTSPTNYVSRSGKQGYIFHADNQQAVSSTFFFPLEFNRDHTIKPLTCDPTVHIPLANATRAPAPPKPHQLDCRIRIWQDIEASFAPPLTGSMLQFPVFQRTDNLGPTTNAGPVLDGSLEVTLTDTRGLSETFTWPASNISWAPSKISMPLHDKRISKLTLSTNATNGCYGTMVQPRANPGGGSYGARTYNQFSEQKKAELYVYRG